MGTVGRLAGAARLPGARLCNSRWVCLRKSGCLLVFPRFAVPHGRACVRTWWLASVFCGSCAATEEMEAKAAILKSVRVRSFQPTSKNGYRSRSVGTPDHAKRMPPRPLSPCHRSARRKAAAAMYCTRAAPVSTSRTTRPRASRAPRGPHLRHCRGGGGAAQAPAQAQDESDVKGGVAGRGDDKDGQWREGVLLPQERALARVHDHHGRRGEAANAQVGQRVGERLRVCAHQGEEAIAEQRASRGARDATARGGEDGLALQALRHGDAALLLGVRDGRRPWGIARKHVSHCDADERKHLQLAALRSDSLLIAAGSAVCAACLSMQARYGKIACEWRSRLDTSHTIA